MAVDDFRITYRGEALDAGTMDVRDLAPALLALSSVIRETSRVQSGDKSDIQVHLKAVSNNCFSVDLSLVQSSIESLFAILGSEKGQAVASLLGLLGITGVGAASGLIGLIKRMKGQIPAKAESVEPAEEGTKSAVKITMPDGVVIEVPAGVWTLYQNPVVRRSMGQIVTPLQKDGIDSIEFVASGEVSESIDQAEAPYFDLPDIDEQLLLKQRAKSAFTIVNLSFKERNKWRLNDGNSTEFVTIEDESFLSKVDANEIAFRKADILVCEVRTRYLQTPSGLKTERFIERVIEHVPAMQQLPLYESSSSKGDASK